MNTSITSAQREQLRRMAADAVEAALHTFSLTHDQVQLVLGQGDAIRHILVEGVRELSQTVYRPITVDYGKSLKQMIAPGHFDQVGENITSRNFRKRNVGVVTVHTVLVHPDTYISSVAVLELLAAAGLRPATIFELIVFGATYPTLQNEFRIAALGSSWVDAGGIRFVGELDADREDDDGFLPEGRSLRLDTFGPEDWADTCRFLAVPLKSP